MTTPIWTLERAASGWPTGLADLAREPSRLYGRGAREVIADLEPSEAVTIVGARRATPYGRQVAMRLARDLATAGFVVVSGMANGIDATAHRGALDGGGRTVAVLAGGPDVPYPPAQRGLYKAILASGGVVVSERPPGERPQEWSFPERNRLMAALGGISIVVESAVRSGSRITADEALKINREVGAVPGPVTSRLSAGTNALIADGAQPIRDAQDVLDKLVGVGAPCVRAAGPPVDGELVGVLDAVEAGHATTDAIANACGGDGRGVAIALVRLELLGYLRADAVGRYARTALERPA